MKIQNTWQNDDQSWSLWHRFVRNHCCDKLNRWQNWKTHLNYTRFWHQSFQKSRNNDEISRNHFFEFRLQVQNSHRVSNVNHEHSEFSEVFFKFLTFKRCNWIQRKHEIEKLHQKLSIKLKNVLSNNFREFFILIEIRIELSKIYNNQKKIRRQRVEKKIARLSRFEYVQFKFIFAISIFVFFVKFITSIFFAKFTIHFHAQFVIQNYDFVIDKLIVIDQCYICDEIEHIWKICFNANKHKKRQWHDMQMMQMNMIFDFSEFDSKNE